VPAPELQRYVYGARLADVYDGDTVHLEVDLGFGTVRHDTFRLLGVQAPEIAGAGVTRAEKDAGVAARDWLVHQLERQALVIQTVKDRREGRGRYLARVFVGGRDVAELMIEAGHACAYHGVGKAPKWVGPRKWRLAGA
jgi:endonuclease YncB( thermonuclease family)